MNFRLISIIGIALIQVALFVLLLVIGLHWLHASHTQELMRRAECAAQLLAVSVATPMRAGDTAAVAALLSQIGFDPDLHDARVFAADGERIAALRESDAAAHPVVLGGSGAASVPANSGATVDAVAPVSVLASVPASAGGQHLGWVEVGLSTTERDALMVQSGRVALAFALLQMALVGGFSAALNKRRGHELAQLQRGAERIASEGPGLQLAQPDDPALRRVAVAFNRMSQQLADSYATLRATLTETRSLMARVAENERQKHQLVETALDGIVSVDERGVVLDYNPSAERLFGYARDEVVGRPLDACLLGSESDADAAVGELLFGAENDGVGRLRELTLLTKDGRRLPLEISAIRWRTERGEYRTAFMRDISDRKRYQEVLEQAAERAREASTAKSRFLASMSHEIRTPLNAILNMNELLLETGLDDEQRDYAATASDSARALLSIVNGVLDFSKIEAGRVEARPQPSDPEEVVKSVVDLLAARAYAKDIQLTVYCDPAVPPRIETDPGLMRQILLNLIGNAIKFTDEGAVRVHVVLNDAADALTIEVIDTGIGIATDKQCTLFDEFVQVDAADNRKYGGSGLGLAISRRLARLLGGDVTLRSTPGEGSCFTLRLPLSAPVDATAEVRTAGALPLRDWCLSVSLDNALVADDLANQLTVFGLSVQIVPPAPVADDAGCHGEILLEPKPGGEAARRGDRPRRVALYQIGNHCRANLVRQGRAIAALRLPVVPSALINRLVQAAAATSPITEPDTGDDLAERLTRCAASAASVLLAEDSHANQLVATTLLRKAGFRVDVAENGLQAVAAVNRRNYGLVLMDVAMPEMDGLEATGCIRALPGKRGRVPIVAMTANAFDEDRQRCLEAGMDDYLSKPIDRRALYEALLRWLDPNTRGGAVVPEPLPMRSRTPDPPTDARAAIGSGDSGETRTVGQGPIDEHVLSALAADLSDELMPSVVGSFIDEAAQRIAAIERAAARGDVALAGEEGHTLKGSAATFGVCALRDTAFAIEQAGRGGSIEGVRAQIDALRRHGEAAMTVLRERFDAQSEQGA